MTQWMNVETAEVIEGHDCPECANATLERDMLATISEQTIRKLQIRIRKLENDVERDKVKHRDAALWDRILERWSATFPDKKISAKDYKSARATAVFLRIEGLTKSMPDREAEELFLAAIAGAEKLPYVVYGKRRSTGAKNDAAIDLADIASVADDRKFDDLVAAGHAGTV